MLDVDRLDAAAALEVVLLDGFRVGQGPLRRPHRHDYHELIWVLRGAGEHRIDDEPLAVRARTVTVIGRGQVHQFREARDVRGALVRFTDEALASGTGRIAAGWLLSGRGGRAIDVPPGECSRVDGLLRALHEELRRPADPYAADVQAHLLAALLLWLERWYDGGHAEREDGHVQLLRRFTARLEEDFARHHDARHYADALGVPPAALARVLQGLTGRTTKELVTDRVMLEAGRLLRFTDLTVGEVAFRTGFDDQLYFSRAFKRHTGRAPSALRGEVHGSAGSVHSG